MDNTTECEGQLTKFHPQTLDPRRAYQVKRYHTWPTTRAQTIGEHSAQVWRILRAIWPDTPSKVLEYALIHDIGEGPTGDLPSTSKTGEIEELKDEQERDAHLQMCTPWSLPPPIRLDEIEKTIFKLAENIEVWEFGLDEMMVGSHNGKLIAQHNLESAKAKIIWLSDNPPADKIGMAAASYIAQRAKFFENVTGSKVP